MQGTVDRSLLERSGPTSGQVQGFTILARIPASANELGAGGVALICPFLRDLEGEAGLWLSALPIHDSNAFVDEDWSLAHLGDAAECCYVGVFALDRLRSQEAVLTTLAKKGVKKLINLPSVSFFDGETAQTFNRLGLSSGMELTFIAAAARMGFGVAFCTRATMDAELLDAVRLDFVLRHRGPGSAMELSPPAMTASHP